MVAVPVAVVAVPPAPQPVSRRQKNAPVAEAVVVVERAPLAAALVSQPIVPVVAVNAVAARLPPVAAHPVRRPIVPAAAVNAVAAPPLHAVNRVSPHAHATPIPGVAAVAQGAKPATPTSVMRRRVGVRMSAVVAPVLTKMAAREIVAPVRAPILWQGIVPVPPQVIVPEIASMRHANALVSKAGTVLVRQTESAASLAAHLVLVPMSEMGVFVRAPAGAWEIVLMHNVSAQGYNPATALVRQTANVKRLAKVVHAQRPRMILAIATTLMNVRTTAAERSPT